MQANLSFDASGGSTFRSTSIVARTSTVTTSGGDNSINFTFTTEGFPNGTLLYWNTVGSVNANTFTDNITSGYCVVRNNTAIVTRSIMNNPSNSQPTAFKLSVSDSVTGDSFTVSSAGVINDLPVLSLSEDTQQYVLYEKPVVAPITPTALSVEPASVTANVSSVNEGGTVAFTVASSGLSNGTYYWDLTSDSLLTASNFDGSIGSGSFILTDNTATISRTIIPNFAVDGLASFAINVRKNSVTGNIFGTSNQILVNDIYTVPPTVSASVSSVNEGDSVTFTVATTGIANGTTLYWTNSGTTSAADFSDSANSGSFTINNDTGTITRTLVSDIVTEGTETIILNIRFESLSGNIIGTSGSVTVNDISGTPTGDQIYSSSGTYTWVVPTGVNSVSVVLVGGGGGGAGGYAYFAPGVGWDYRGSGGGAGGALIYKNNISVTPGQTVTCIVGRGGPGGSSGTSYPGVASSSNWGGNTSISIMTYSSPGGRSPTSGNNNGEAPLISTSLADGSVGYTGGIGYDGGGGAAGYAGSGINPLTPVNSSLRAGGGAGSGGFRISDGTPYDSGGAGGGGGVGLYGLGSTGTAGTRSSTVSTGGGGGSGGSNGSNTVSSFGGSGGLHGGGGGGGWGPGSGGSGASGAIRIVWPGTTRQFPSTNVS